MCHSALISSVCEAQIVTRSGVVPILHFSTWPLCRNRVLKRRALKKENSAQLAILKISVAFCPASRPHSSTHHGGEKWREGMARQKPRGTAVPRPHPDDATKMSGVVFSSTCKRKDWTFSISMLSAATSGKPFTAGFVTQVGWKIRRNVRFAHSICPPRNRLGSGGRLFAQPAAAP
jgi:hypothetical protein